jgi:serine/threonine protein kinase
MENGTKFGHYTIEKKLGEGGMGEVYLATDNSLERLAALKILSENFSRDAERIQRLKQEAKAASALNHPNIITIYEIGRTDDIEFIAMEYVEGRTLREVIEGGELTLKDVVGIAAQIAEGLGNAHRVRIVHRDIKPENIIVRNDGYVRILDFGLAKPTAMPTADNESETAKLIKTAPGVVLGSVRYMSPEQARGKTVDERSDVWSLGVVLYEMTTGKAPFDGETVSDTLANLIHLEPRPLAESSPDTPAELHRIVDKCLQKNIENRYQNANEIAFDLKNLKRELEADQSFEKPLPIHSTSADSRIFSEETKTRLLQTDEDFTRTKITNPATNAPTKNSRSITPFIFGGIVASVLIIGALVAIGLGIFAAKTDHKADKFLNPQISKLSDDGKSRLPAISPDGKYVAFQSGDAGAKSIVVRQLATGSSVEIVPKSGLRILALRFSPDTNYVYFVQGDAGNSVYSLYQVPTLGGTAKLIVTDIDSNVTFSPDGKKIAFTRHNGSEGTDTLLTANIDGTGEKAVIATPQTDYGYLGNPIWSPNGEKIVVAVSTFKGGETDSVFIAEVSPDGGKLNLLENGKWANLSALFWLGDGSGFFALGSEKGGEPDQVWKISYPNGERKRITNDTNSYNWLGVSGDDKTLITVKSDATSSIWNFNPSTKSLRQITGEGRNLNGDSGIVVKPDGNLIVSRKQDSGINFWEITPDGKDVRQIVSDAKLNADPRISPDGTKIVFMSNRSGLWRVWLSDIDGKNARQLTNVGDEVNQFSPNFADGGKIIFYNQQEKNSGVTKLMRVSADGGTPEKVFNDDNNESNATISPDGKKLFFSSSAADYKKTLHIFPLDGDKIGTAESNFEIGLMESIEWSPDGKSLTYISGEGTPNLWQISLDGKAKKQLTDFNAGRIFSYAATPDGKQIYLSRGTVNNEMILIKDDAK